MKEFNLDLKDKSSGWKKKMGNDKFKDGYRCFLYQKKSTQTKTDMVRVDCSLKAVSKQSIVDYFIDPPFET